MWRFEYELEVLFRDCDPMGHVNNAVYLTYLEAARFAWWRNAFGAQGLKEHGFIVARVEIDYRKAALPATGCSCGSASRTSADRASKSVTRS
jgi:acyl-CoA thioesterase FadM